MRVAVNEQKQTQHEEDGDDDDDHKPAIWLTLTILKKSCDHTKDNTMRIMFELNECGIPCLDILHFE